MNEKLKKTAETLWQDEKDFLTVLALAILGLKNVITTLREPFQPSGIATIHNLEPSRSHTPQLDREKFYPTAA